MNPYAYAGSNPVMFTDPSGLMMPLTLQEMGNTYVSNGHLNQALDHFERNLSQIKFNDQLPTVNKANANLKINGGSGNDVRVNANRLRVEPNGSKNWELNTDTKRYQLPVRVNGWLNQSGQWVNEGSFPYSVPTGNSRGYWVYGELTLSDNMRLFDDPYDFEYHSLSSADGIGGKAMVAGRNALTWLGGLYSNSPSGAKGYNHVFYETPY
nr:hypothetical protein [Acinetobacter haemolyticus]